MNKYHIGQFIEPMDNSFTAIKTEKNEVGVITTEGIQLSKLMFSHYYSPVFGEEKARFKITKIEQREWRHYSEVYNDTLQYLTLTVKSSSTNVEYYIAIWSKDYAPRIM